MAELNCEKIVCNTDQRTFKAYLSRWMAATAQLAPFTAAGIMPKLRASAKGAAAQCSGGPDGKTCGKNWAVATWDGISGVEEQMTALAIFGANLLPFVPGPASKDNGGTSKADPNAGTGFDPNEHFDPTKDPVTTGDKAGAAFLTLFILAGVLGFSWWMIT